MNFVFISPNFPKIYSHFVKALAERGVTVLGIGDAQYNELNDELKTYLKEYCFVSDMIFIVLRFTMICGRTMTKNMLYLYMKMKFGANLC